jgi:hypothetical protein
MGFLHVGKSICYQLPALITGKVVVVISPLISLMHDQCLQLAASGVSACFLGSGQPDHTVERKAMYGQYSLVYICPESLPRWVKWHLGVQHKFPWLATQKLNFIFWRKNCAIARHPAPCLWWLPIYNIVQISDGRRHRVLMDECVRGPAG